MEEHREEHRMVGRVARIEARLDAMEENQKNLDRVFRSSVDDIKSIIKAEVSDLKSEQITDLRREIATTQQRLDGQNILIADLRTRQEQWDTGRSVLNWLIKFLVGAGGLIAGYYGSKHLG